MREMPTPGRPLGLASTDGLGPTAPYVPVLERGPQDTAHSEMMRLLELSRQQATEIERLRALLARYRDETPLGHQPHMIAHQADEALGRA